MECFQGIIHASEVNAKALTEYLLSFLNNKVLSLHKFRGLGFGGANTMSGEKSGVRKHMRCVCQCHQLPLAAVYSANEHMKGNEFRYPSYCMESFPLFT